MYTLTPPPAADAISACFEMLERLVGVVAFHAAAIA